MKPLEQLQPQLPAILQDLEAIVTLEAPSYDLPGLDRVARWIAGQFEPYGTLERQETENGPVLRVQVPGSGKKVLVLCHFDTVHPVGAFGVPWKVEGERAYGPGVYDMKGNIVQLLWALRTNAALGLGRPQLELLFTPDEEVGSQASRAAIESGARRNDLVLVLEAPMGNGDLKVARKGVGQYRLTAHGKPAHQGVEPEKGINAIVELAHQIPKIVALQDWNQGTTLGPNVVKGGTTSNVVAASAWVDIDLRAWTVAEAERVERELRALQPVLPGASLSLEGGLNRPPMEPSSASLELFEMARRIGAEVGLQLGPGRVGGGSDGNFTAALGVPTLDGLGLFGEAAHQLTENVYIPQIPARIALLCGILDELSRVKLSSSAQKVQDALHQKGFGHLRVQELAASTRTAQEAAAAVGCAVGQIVKSLIFRGAISGQPYLLLVSGVNQVNTHQLEESLGERLVKPDGDYVRIVTGFAIGGVPPVGHAQHLEALIDPDLLQYERIYAAAGTPFALFGLSPNELLALTGGRIMQMT